MSDMVMRHGYNSSTGEKTGAHWGSLASQSTLIKKPQVLVRDPTYFKNQGNWLLRNTTKDSPLASTHICVCTGTHTCSENRGTCMNRYTHSHTKSHTQYIIHIIFNLPASK